MKSDSDLINEAYEQVIQMAVASPDIHQSEDHGCDAKEMMQSQIETISTNIQSIYANLSICTHVEPWVAEKITLANDYLNTVQEWLAHQTRKGISGE